MKLADKQVYPHTNYSDHGVTYKEALVLALARNPKIMEGSYNVDRGRNLNIDTQKLFDATDAIIKEMEKE